MKYRVSVAEMWYRNYLIEADTPEQSVEKYYKYLKSGLEDENDIENIWDPEYLADIAGDIEVYSEDGNIVLTSDDIKGLQ